MVHSRQLLHGVLRSAFDIFCSVALSHAIRSGLALCMSFSTFSVLLLPSLSLSTTKLTLGIPKFGDLSLRQALFGRTVVTYCFWL